MKYVPEDTRKCIVADACHKCSEEYTDRLLIKQLKQKLPFRNVFYWRIEQVRDGVLLKICEKVLKILIPPLNTIEIFVEGGIGADFYIPHRYCVINAKSIGKHVSILQGVTIGKDNNGNKPVIGNNVVIYPNSVIAGKVTIGDNVYIGANTFVNFDIKDNSTVKAVKPIIMDYKNEGENNEGENNEGRN